MSSPYFLLPLSHLPYILILSFLEQENSNLWALLR